MSKEGRLSGKIIYYHDREGEPSLPLVLSHYGVLLDSLTYVGDSSLVEGRRGGNPDSSVFAVIA